jgi:imidazole glycerol-phosphate synthase subunit HisH
MNPAEKSRPRVAIVDYGLGNIFSVKQACAQVGLEGFTTAAPDDLWQADAVILPGVGAFADAMATLRKLGMESTLRDIAKAGKPTLGICLGFQLFMSESHEFGQHRGLGLFEGDVAFLQDGLRAAGRPVEARPLKIPNMGWSGIRRAVADGGRNDPWAGTLLAGLEDGTEMYFVHSYFVTPARTDDRLAESRFGELTYCCALQRGNVFGCQFHPERSGELGLKVYANLRDHIAQGTKIA